MKLQVVLSRLVVGLLLIVIAVPFPAVEAEAAFPFEAADEFTPTTTLADGAEIVALEINSPPHPSPEFAEERAASMVTSLDRADVKLPDFPSYSWVFGCSAVSAAMIAAYYDNNGYPNLYTGPTNGGAMPNTDTVWGTWSDGYYTYPNNPLVASRAGLDGRGALVKGSIDDYWVTINSTANDPYITGSWIQHTWGTAVGDFMKTSQSLYENIDGSTWFYYALGNSKLQCSSMPIDDGTYGRKLFYEARGYTVTDCFYQQTDNKVSGGFSLLDFKAEIDAGHPVLINVTGHSMVGFGYNGSTIYIRDTWNSNPNNNYSMTWGGTYDGRELLGISIVHLTEPSSAPGAFSKSSPSNGALTLSDTTLSWGSSSGADEYEYCVDDTNNNLCDTSWVTTGLNTSVSVSGLALDTPYYWQVRATNTGDTTYANGSATAFWAFTPVVPKFNYLPFILK
jgi:hypothetical protein